jgi:hypothetical protein
MRFLSLADPGGHHSLAAGPPGAEDMNIRNLGFLLGSEFLYGAHFRSPHKIVFYPANVWGKKSVGNFYERADK